MKKTRIISLVLGAILLLGCVLGAFWQDIRVYLLPGTVLKDALEATMEDLSRRYEGSPLLLLADCLGENGSSRITVQALQEKELLGTVQYDLTLDTQLDPMRIRGSGTVTGGSQALDLQLYLDSLGAAVASDSLSGGQYYGVTYATFAQDIRSSAMLAFFLGEDTISGWQTDLEELERIMSGGFSLPELSLDQMDLALTALSALPAGAERTGEGYTVSYSCSGALLTEGAALAGVELPVALDADSQLTLEFYIEDERLVSARGNLTGPEPMAVQLTIDADTLHISLETDGQWALTVQTISSDNLYTEQLTLLSGGEETTIRYSWDRETGDASLSRGDLSVALRLTEGEGSVQLETADLEALLAIVTEGEDGGNSPATVTIAPGTAVEAVSYKNLDQWSLEDLMSLMNALGSLIISA